MSEAKADNEKPSGDESSANFSIGGIEITPKRMIAGALMIVISLVIYIWQTRTSDVDGKFDEIKAAIKSLDENTDETMIERIDNVKESVENLGESIEKQVKSLDSKVEQINVNLEKRLKEVEEEVDDLDGRVSSLEGDMKQIKENVNNIKEGGNRREEKLDQLQEMLKNVNKK